MSEPVDAAQVAAEKKREAGLTVIEPEPAGASVAEVMKEALEGVDRVSSIAIAFVYRDGTTGTAWSDVPSMGLLLGAIGRLQYEMAQRLAGE